MAEPPKPHQHQQSHHHHSDESVKLFVGQVPKHMTEQQLTAMFKEFALVEQVNIIKDKATRASRGCCFVICPSREEADKAVDACHNKKTLPGATCPMQVKYADGEVERLEHKLFVGMLPKNVSESEVSDLFSQYGTIKDQLILRGSQQTSKGCAFVKYETKEQALAAIDGLNGKHKMEGSTVPLVVKWADTERERLARKAQKATIWAASNFANADMTHPSLFGALPMGYISPYNNYGYQAPGNYGLMQYPLSPGQNQPSFPDGTPHVRGGTPRNYPVHAYPMAYPGGMMSGPPSPVPQSVLNNLPATSSSGGASPGDHVEGPPGANLFIYHIPQEFDDAELANTFKEFGRVLSAKVFVDKATGVSKCFGFVSYNTSAAAESAINTMNGYQIGGKKLKVQLKRDNKQNQPQ
ncbi:putative RNA recognition motif domain, paraneoplastic encephalomyelitis antigen [Helianthus annuus]|nr:putative RNA recognition motif domain, paraneoplastic encephalomyelitis antigen [Helianthus annuus]